MKTHLEEVEDMSRTVEYVMALTGVEKEKIAERVRSEKDNYTEVMAKAKSMGFSQPYWHGVQGFYERNRLRQWDSLSEKAQAYALKISRSLGATPILFGISEPVVPKTPAYDSLSKATAETLDDLVAKSREVKNKVVEKRRKPKWTWTKSE